MCFQGVAQSECMKAVDAAEVRYSEVFSRDVLANDEDLDKEHIVCAVNFTSPSTCGRYNFLVQLSP